MKFVRVTQLADGVEPLRDRLMLHLADGSSVLWLVPGGSNIPLTVAVMSQIPDELTERLTIMLTDERYGEVGHKDSNAFQLDETGFLPTRATVIPVLSKDLSPEDTRAQYAASFREATAAADVIIGQFGMGADGHIGGILPGSEAVASADMAAMYKTPEFTRITLTPGALAQLTVAYVFAFGDNKRSALLRLQSETVSISDQPAQLLKHLPEAYVYNDQIDQAEDQNEGDES